MQTVNVTKMNPTCEISSWVSVSGRLNTEVVKAVIVAVITTIIAIPRTASLLFTVNHCHFAIGIIDNV